MPFEFLKNIGVRFHAQELAAEVSAAA